MPNLRRKTLTAAAVLLFGGVLAGSPAYPGEGVIEKNWRWGQKDWARNVRKFPDAVLNDIQRGPGRTNFRRM